VLVLFINSCLTIVSLWFHFVCFLFVSVFHVFLYLFFLFFFIFCFSFFFFFFIVYFFFFFFFFSSRRRHTRSDRDWSSDVCSSDLLFLLQMLILIISMVIGQMNLILLKQNCQKEQKQLIRN